MKRSIPLILLLVSTILFGSASIAGAQEHGTLSARISKSHKGVKIKAACQPYRVNDCGKPLKSWCQQVVYRATNDTFVYRSENKATTRDDEISSHAIMFHLQCGEVRPGHVYEVRGN